MGATFPKRRALHGLTEAFACFGLTEAFARFGLTEAFARFAIFPCTTVTSET